MYFSLQVGQTSCFSLTKGSFMVCDAWLLHALILGLLSLWQTTVAEHFFILTNRLIKDIKEKRVLISETYTCKPRLLSVF